jgi:hypothetical protein
LTFFFILDATGPEQFLGESNNGNLLDEDAIGMLLYNAREKFNFCREGYDVFISIINQHIMGFYGKVALILSNHDNIVDGFFFCFFLGGGYIDPDGKRIPSGDQTLETINSACPVTYQRFDCCPTGCKMYLDDPDDEFQRQCSHCNVKRYLDEDEAKPAAYVKKTSITSIIASKLANPLTRMQMRYREERQLNSNAATDIFDGHFYKSLVANDYFNNPDDVAIGLYLDGFNPFKTNTFQCTLVNMIIYNINQTKGNSESITT